MSRTPLVRVGSVLVATVGDELDDDSALQLQSDVGQEVVAMAAYTLFEDHLMLCKLYVLPDAQGSGAGGALLTEVIARAGDLPVRLTHLVGNDRAHAVYERLGFVETGTVVSPIDGGPEEVAMERPAGRR